MANLSKLKLKRPNSLGAPPPLDEASRNLKASEIAPSVAVSPAVTPIRASAKPAPVEAENPQPSRIDGRSLRKSGRLIPFATRVSQEFDERLRKIAQRDRLLLVEVMEQALDAYEAARDRL